MKDRDRTSVKGAELVVTTGQIVRAVVGLLVLQLAWVILIPPFGGSDEFDHAYRAASVARGDWVADPANATRGTGAWLEVPRDIVVAARPECERLPYTTDDDCVGTTKGDDVRIASGAGRYHPLFYALVGWPSLPLHGTSALYAMRAANILLCTAFLFLGLLALRRWARSRWLFTGAVVACTPVVLYSTTVVAPNGLEMATAFAFWTSVLGLLRASNDPRRRGIDTLLLVTATSSGAMLMTVRSLGPLWCALIVATALVAVPGSIARVGDLLRRPSFLGASLVLAAAGIGSLVWTRTMGSLVVGVEHVATPSLAHRVEVVAGLVPLWFFQSMAAFPYRDQPSPAIVYASVTILGIAFFGWAWARTDRRNRLTIAVCLTLAALVPSLITIVSYTEYHGAWQGRYGLPYSLGLPLLLGLALEDRDAAPRKRWIVVGASLSTLAVVGAFFGVRDIEALSPTITAGTWHLPAAALMVVLGVIGTALLWTLSWSSGNRPSRLAEPAPAKQLAANVES